MKIQENDQFIPISSEKCYQIIKFQASNQEIKNKAPFKPSSMYLYFTSLITCKIIMSSIKKGRKLAIYTKI